jgi:hypothetical protein
MTAVLIPTSSEAEWPGARRKGVVTYLHEYRKEHTS